MKKVAEAKGRDEQSGTVCSPELSEYEPVAREGQKDDDDDGRDGYDQHRAAAHQKNAVGTEHDEIAMGEVDQAHDAEDQPDAQRGHSVDTS